MEVFPLKSKQQKKDEAFDRLEASEFKNSKAKRQGKSQEQWETEKRKRIEELS